MSYACVHPSYDYDQCRSYLPLLLRACPSSLPLLISVNGISVAVGNASTLRKSDAQDLQNLVKDALHRQLVFSEDNIRKQLGLPCYNNAGRVATVKSSSHDKRYY
eukprot:1183994-Prorocentrum_minimum.AAC.5